MAGKGGGAWKVAYADFVTAMMAFFMVMWLTAQSSDVKTAVAEHFRNPGGRRFAGSEAKSLVTSNNVGQGSRRVVKSKGSKKTENEARVRKMTDEGERSNIGKIVPFELNSVQLVDAGRKELLDFLPELEGKQHKIEVRGHSASGGGKSDQAILDSLMISYKRCLAVRQFIIDQGIDHRRIRISQAGSTEPRDITEPLDEAGDCRVEVFMLKEIYEEAESKASRLVNTKSLDDKAKVLAAEEAAEAASAEKKSGGH